MSSTVTAPPPQLPVPVLVLRARLIACLSLARMQARQQFAYRADFIFRLAGLFLQIYLSKLVWTAVYGGSHSVLGSNGHVIPLATQLAYVSLASVQSWLLNPWGLSLLAERVRDGTVAVDLARPLRFTTQLLVAQAGTLFAVAPFALLALPFAIGIGEAQPPASTAALAAYSASLVPAYLSSLLLTTTVSMVSFWTLEVTGIFMIYRMVVQFFTGALVPLWFMSGSLRALAGVLPFQGLTYQPVALYLGQTEGLRPVLGALAAQWGWVFVLCLLLRLVWSRAQHRIVVQGG